MMHNRTLLIFAMLAAIVTLPSPASSQSAVTALPTCEGKLQVRPSSVIFACGDGGVYATDVRWSQWGSAFATARATMHANDCTPNCAQGHFQVYAAYLAVSGSQRCANGENAYARASYVPRSKGLPTSRSRLDWYNYSCH